MEDNADNADLVRDILADRFHIIHFPTAAPLLRGLRERTVLFPELLLIDISLPGMNGAQLLREIRNMPRYQSIPAIAITAHAMEEDRQRFLEAGFDDYISKPIVEEETLLDAITALFPSEHSIL